MPLYPPAGGAGGAAISAGTQSQNTGTVVFSNSNGISFGLNNGTLTATVTPGAAAGIAAASAGTQVQTSGTLNFVNSNGITFGMSGSSQITVNFGSSSLAGTGFTTTTIAGAVVAGTNATNGLLLAVPSFLTTAALSGDTTKYAGLGTTFNGANVSGSMTLNTAGLQLSLSAGAGGAGDGGNTLAAGTRTAGSNSVVLFSNSNGATWGLNAVNGSVMTLDFGSSSLAGTGFTTTTVAGSVIAGTHATNGMLLAVPAFLTTQSVQTQASGNIARTGFTTTTVAGSVIAGTHDTAGLLLAVPAFLTTQSVQTQASGDIARSGFTTTTVAGSVIAGTHDTAGLKLAVPAFLTTAALSGDTTKYAGLGFTSTTTAGTDVKGTQSTNGLSMAFPAWLTTAALSADSSKYAGTGFTSTTTAGTDVKATLNTAGLSMAVPAYLTAAAGGGTALTMYATSNTTQSSSGTMAMSSMIFAGAGIASVGITNGSVLISVPSGGGAGDGVNIVQAGSTGTTGTTWSSLSATISLNGYGALTVSQNNSNQIGLSVPATSSLVGSSGISISTAGSTITVYQTPMSSAVIPSINMTMLGAMGNGSFSIAYRDIDFALTATRVDMPFFWSQATAANANTIAIAMTVLCGIYTRNASTLNTVSSATTQTTYTYASNSAGVTALTVAAYRPISIPMNVNMTPGVYYLGFGISTSASSIGTATTTAAQTISAMGISAVSSAVPWVGDFSQVTNTSVGMLSGHGVYSAAVNSVAPAISLSAINQSGSYFNRANIALVFRN